MPENTESEVGAPSAKNPDWRGFFSEYNLEKKFPWDAIEPAMIQSVLEKFNIQNGRMLDLGCSDGKKSLFFSQHGFEVEGIDLSESAIKIAQARAKKAGQQINFMSGNVLDHDFPNKYDVALDIGLFHNLPQEKLSGFAEKIAGRLTDQGHYVLVCLSKNTPQEHQLAPPVTHGIKPHYFSKEDVEGYFKSLKILYHDELVIDSDWGRRWVGLYLMEKLKEA